MKKEAEPLTGRALVRWRKALMGNILTSSGHHSRAQAGADLR